MNKTDVLIIGSGPTGLFCAHQLGIIGLSCEIVDNLDKAAVNALSFIPINPFMTSQLSLSVLEKS